jgi:Ca2+-binding RTX toxin-like protein
MNIYGSNLGDLLSGTDGADSIFGHGGNDLIRGRSGNDYIHAGNGNDYIEGGGGADEIVGGLGHDTITGGWGNDRIGGGLGSDIFIFRGASGHDTIYGWEDGYDRIEIQDVDRFSDLRLDNIGYGVRISWDDSSIILPEADISDFGRADFIL